MAIKKLMGCALIAIFSCNEIVIAVDFNTKKQNTSIKKRTGLPQILLRRRKIQPETLESHVSARCRQVVAKIRSDVSKAIDTLNDLVEKTTPDQLMGRPEYQDCLFKLSSTSEEIQDSYISLTQELHSLQNKHYISQAKAAYRTLMEFFSEEDR